jgi:hypothetical protein
MRCRCRLFVRVPIQVREMYLRWNLHGIDEEAVAAFDLAKVVAE